MESTIPSEHGEIKITTNKAEDIGKLPDTIEIVLESDHPVEALLDQINAVIQAIVARGGSTKDFHLIAIEEKNDHEVGLHYANHAAKEAFDAYAGS